MTSLKLIEMVYMCLFEGTESFEKQNIGADGLYLVGAILRNKPCHWPESRPIVRLLRKTFPAHHTLWGFIVIHHKEK